MYAFSLFEFNSGFSGSDDVDKGYINEGNINESAINSDRIDAYAEGFKFIRQLARVLLTSFGGHYVVVGGRGILCFFYYSMLLLQRLLHVSMCNGALLLDPSPLLCFY